VSASILGLGLAGLSAIGSSAAHALLKSGEDMVAVQAWSSLLALGLALPLLFWVGAPEPSIIPWLAAGWALHTIYYLLLIRSYSISDYSLAYPIARGVVPIGTTLLGVALLGDRPENVAIVGALAIGIGIMVLGLREGAMSREGLLFAILCGLVNMAFTLVDAKALRTADNFMNFLVWYFILDGISMPLLFAVRNWGNMRSAAMASARHGLSAGVMALIAYVPALIAYRFAPVGVVSAIRATSPLFGMLFAGRYLDEAVDWRRIIGAALVTGGACAIIASTQLMT
jgi:drug/metabolite transporter (DMT)-like permease